MAKLRFNFGVVMLGNFKMIDYWDAKIEITISSGKLEMAAGLSDNTDGELEMTGGLSGNAGGELEMTAGLSDSTGEQLEMTGELSDSTGGKSASDF